MHTQIAHRALLGGLMVAAIGAFFFSTALSAEALTLNASSTASSTLPKPKAKLDASCVSEAVADREDALLAALGVFNTDITAALTARKTALVAAWNEATLKARTAALKTAWKEWKASSKAAHTELRSERKSAWDTFKKTTKSECKVNLPQEEALEKAKSDTVTL